MTALKPLSRQVASPGLKSMCAPNLTLSLLLSSHLRVPEKPLIVKSYFIPPHNQYGWASEWTTYCISKGKDVSSASDYSKNRNRANGRTPCPPSPSLCGVRELMETKSCSGPHLRDFAVADSLAQTFPGDSDERLLSLGVPESGALSPEAWQLYLKGKSHCIYLFFL